MRPTACFRGMLLAAALLAGCATAPSPTAVLTPVPTTTTVPATTPAASPTPVPVSVGVDFAGCSHFCVQLTGEWRFEDAGVVAGSGRVGDGTPDATPYEVRLLPGRYDLVVTLDDDPHVGPCRLGVDVHAPRTDLSIYFYLEDPNPCEAFDHVGGTIFTRCDPVPDPAPAVTCAAAVLAALPASGFAATDVGEAFFSYGNACPTTTPCPSAPADVGYVIFDPHPAEVTTRYSVLVQIAWDASGNVTVDATMPWLSFLHPGA